MANRDGAHIRRGSPNRIIRANKRVHILSTPFPNIKYLRISLLDGRQCQEASLNAMGRCNQMRYQYETLSPETFQQFCQSLLLMYFPHLRCFPVGQPDGGRDAIAWRPKQGSRDRDFIVFQVKFNRKPLAEPDPHKWLVEQIRKEKSKIKRLIPRGAKEYYLITNVPGTAHLDVGSIDELDALLAQ
jgi:hypothetical protein